MPFDHIDRTLIALIAVTMAAPLAVLSRIIF